MGKHARLATDLGQAKPALAMMCFAWGVVQGRGQSQEKDDAAVCRRPYSRCDATGFRHHHMMQNVLQTKCRAWEWG